MTDEILTLPEVAQLLKVAEQTATKKQVTLLGVREEAAATQGWGEGGAPKAATTTLNPVHQATLLIGTGRGEAPKHFLVEEGGGGQPQYRTRAPSLSAIYPGRAKEKRWGDVVLARMKGSGN